MRKLQFFQFIYFNSLRQVSKAITRSYPKEMPFCSLALAPLDLQSHTSN